MAQESYASPLPRPTFFDSPPLSTKRERQLKGSQTRVPRLCRSVQSVSRFMTERFEHHGPRFITYRTDSDNVYKAENAVYNSDDPREYFDQCFENEGKIGEGSFGEVFRVKSKVDGKYYAVKRTIEPFRNSRDRELKLREVQKHELLPKHPNLVAFKGAWEEGGQLYIQMELCEYSLADYAAQHYNIPEGQLWSYLADMVAAVHHLHEQDLLHLDIKPENIFISPDNTCKLGDFGLIFDLKRDSIITAQDGDGKYLSKEVLNNPPGKPADIFALGISMLELATSLELPSHGPNWHLFREGHIPDSFTRVIPPKLRRLIFLMMEFNPEKRPTARELFHDKTVRSYLKKRYPLNYGLTSFIGDELKEFWTFLSYFIWIVLLPFVKPIRWLIRQCSLEKPFRLDSPVFRRKRRPGNRQQIYAFAPLSIDSDSSSDETNFVNSNHCNTSPGTSEEVVTNLHDNSGSPVFTNINTFRFEQESDQGVLHRVSPNASNRNIRSPARLVDSNSPVSSRHRFHQDFTRSVMSEPTRRPPFLHLCSNRVRPVGRIDFSCVDNDEGAASETPENHAPIGREIGDRGSSADELEY